MGGIWEKQQYLKEIYLLLCDFFLQFTKKIHCCYDYTCHKYSYIVKMRKCLLTIHEMIEHA